MILEATSGNDVAVYVSLACPPADSSAIKLAALRFVKGNMTNLTLCIYLCF